MESGGGIQLWCSNCAGIRECKVLWYDNTSKGNFYNTEFPDLQWRERPRECNSCGHHFNTYEIEAAAISELIELRKLLKDIQKSIETQQKFPTAIEKIINSPNEE